MDPRFGAFNVTTGLLAACTIWVLVARLRGTIQSNWPLVYYAGVVLYSTIFPGYIDPAWVYSGVVCSLFLRFEFMAGFFLTIVRGIDIAVLCYVAYTTISHMIL